MIVHTEVLDIPAGGGAMRCFLATPAWPGATPASSAVRIFQLTGLMRACVRLAGHGFTVLAPEIYHRLEAPGTVLGFRRRRPRLGPEDAAHAGAPLRRRLPLPTTWRGTQAVAPGQLGAAGCIGGHLAFSRRAAARRRPPPASTPLA